MNRIRTRDRGWVRALNSVERPARRLVCFPHSGGSATTFRDWSSAVPGDCELLAVQYPGHADRIAEEPASSVGEIAARVVTELLDLDPVPCALFGHSLGALVAYETARGLQDRARPVRNLFVSGAPAPGRAGGGTTHLATDDDLWSGLRDLGGIDPLVAEDAELRELLLPIVRADITLNETYRADPHAEPLDCWIRCYRTTEDPLVDGERLAAWAEVGTGRFSARTWPGGHFGLVSDPAELIADLVAAFAEGVVVR
ncbi:thioesterase II family protein [Streptomyces sp. NPDC048350]|uniref:thioesterase II family protein n=1 Tax=Streptomyces sp. NPDC048350 TaxID=3365538 RepID=UPI00371CAEDD